MAGRVGALVVALVMVGCHHQEKGCEGCPCLDDWPRCNEPDLECWNNTQCQGVRDASMQFDAPSCSPQHEACGGVACCEDGQYCAFGTNGWGCWWKADASAPTDGPPDVASADAPADAGTD
jgi:hypothetical protein